MARKDFEATSDQLSNGKALNLSEIGDPGPIEKVSDTTDLVKVQELEAFMHEPVTIRVAQTSEDGSLPVICPAVNGVNQPIIRGVPISVKRKYVEALARTRITKYEQQVQNPMMPENIQMLEKPVLVFPFEVLEDKNPKGRAWLQAILNQP